MDIKVAGATGRCEVQHFPLRVPHLFSNPGRRGGLKPSFFSPNRLEGVDHGKQGFDQVGVFYSQFTELVAFLVVGDVVGEDLKQVIH